MPTRLRPPFQALSLLAVLGMTSLSVAQTTPKAPPAANMPPAKAEQPPAPPSADPPAADPNQQSTTPTPVAPPIQVPPSNWKPGQPIKDSDDLLSALEHADLTFRSLQADLRKTKIFGVLDGLAGLPVGGWNLDRR